MDFNKHVLSMYKKDLMCPHCGGRYHSFSEPEYQGLDGKFDTLYIKCTCETCHRKWTEVWKLTKIFSEEV